MNHIRLLTGINQGQCFFTTVVGQFCCKLEQLIRESEGSFREVEGYYSTQTLGLYIHMIVGKSFGSLLRSFIRSSIA